MEEHHTADDHSHYEISLTAGQAFVAFVLLLLSLAASFAFGLMLGKGQADERLVVRKETPVVTEANLAPSKRSSGQIVELGVDDDDFQDSAAAEPQPETATAPVIEDEPLPASAVEDAPQTAEPARQDDAAAVIPAAVAAAAPPAAVAHNVRTYAQLLSTGDQKVAEALAVKLIDRGFNTAYVERGSNDKGPIFRVRVRFESETDARAAEPKLREFSKEVWITSR